MEINKDFYNNLPSMVCQELDDSIIPTFSKEEWFEKAWEEYRQHIKESNMDTMKMPSHIFKKYYIKSLDTESIIRSTPFMEGELREDPLLN